MNLVTIPYGQSTTIELYCFELIAYEVIEPSLQSESKIISDTNWDVRIVCLL